MKSHEGESLKRIVILRYGNLKNCAMALSISYEHLVRECKKSQLNNSFRANISQLLNLDPVTLAPKGEPPAQESVDWKARAEESLLKLADLQAKYIAILEELRNRKE